MTELFAYVNGIKLCYDIHGKGNSVILIHGFSDRKEHWRAQVGELSKFFKIIRLDNRGAGKSDRPEGEYSMKVYASDVAGLMDFLGIEKAHIIGHSMGGMIAQNFTLIYPNRINKLVLINTLAGMALPRVPTDRAFEIYRESAIEDVKALRDEPLNNFLKLTKRSYSREFHKQMVANPKKKFHGIWSVEDLVEEKTNYGPTEKDIDNLIAAFKTHNTYERLHEIKNETLIIAAEKDKSCSVPMNEKIHELIPNSKFIIIKNAAHQSILEKAPEINKIIIDFLKS
jgi:3-oxoadipate enol-lactonase